MRCADRGSHFFDAAMKLVARLPTYEERRTRGAKLLQIDAPMSRRTAAEFFRRKKNLLRWKSDTAGTRRLFEALLKSREEFVVGLLQNLRLVENQHGRFGVVEQCGFHRLNDRHQIRCARK